MKKDTKILGVEITTYPEEKILEYIQKKLELPKNRRGKTIIFTPNPEQISHAVRDSEFKAKLNKADIALPDGMGVVWAARLLGKSIKGRIAGVDFMKNIVKTVSKEPVNIGLFGGQGKVAEAALDCLQKMPVFSSPESTKVKFTYVSNIYDKQNLMQSDIDILFVALGSPKQEEWILEHKDEVPASIIMAVGGAFDFISGRVPRAPRFIQSIGLEWLFRLTIQPWRIFRQVWLLHFGALVLLEALSGRFSKS